MGNRDRRRIEAGRFKVNPKGCFSKIKCMCITDCVDTCDRYPIAINYFIFPITDYFIKYKM